MKDKSNIREMNIYERFFRMIQKGEKTIEVRVAYSGMKKIKPGTVIRFRCKNSFSDQLVIRVGMYSSFEEMMRSEDFSKINPYLSVEDQLKEIRKIFPPNKEKIGVITFEVQSI